MFRKSFASGSGSQFLRIFQHCRISHFPQLCSRLCKKSGIKWKNWSNLRGNFIIDISSERKSSLNIRSHLDQKFGLRIPTEFTLAEVSTLWVLLSTSLFPSQPGSTNAQCQLLVDWLTDFVVLCAVVGIAIRRSSLSPKISGRRDRPAPTILLLRKLEWIVIHVV